MANERVPPLSVPPTDRMTKARLLLEAVAPLAAEEVWRDVEQREIWAAAAEEYERMRFGQLQTEALRERPKNGIEHLRWIAEEIAQGRGAGLSVLDGMTIVTAAEMIESPEFAVSPSPPAVARSEDECGPSGYKCVPAEEVCPWHGGPYDPPAVAPARSDLRQAIEGLRKDGEDSDLSDWNRALVAVLALLEKKQP